jgi:NNP family nitrate/nitrite transporter-like MFS transporter
MPGKEKIKGAFMEACRDYRVWALFLVYGACFGIELTINNIAVLYFMDYFELGLKAAGAVAAAFGLLNIFARTLGGVLSDRSGKRWGLRGRVSILAVALACEGVTLMIFSQMTVLTMAIIWMMVFSLFVKMAQGATFSIVPFINKRALGSVAGIVGAGGNFGAVGAGFLLKAEAVSWPTALFIMGVLVLVCAGLATFIRFSERDESIARDELDVRLGEALEPVAREAA